MTGTDEPLECPRCGEEALFFKSKIFWKGTGKFQCDSCNLDVAGIQAPSRGFIEMDTIHE